MSIGESHTKLWERSGRVEQHEWLDLGYGSSAEVAASLAEMGRLNRYLGGLRALTVHLYPRLAALALQQDEITLLDLGTGAAEIPSVLSGWARQHKIRLHILAVDLAQRHLEVARAQVATLPEVRLVRADVRCLPLLPKSVDVVISSLFLHHFSPSDLAALLRHAADLARCSLVMSDLVRGQMPFLAFKLIQPVFARCRLTRHDGAVSIRRAYTPVELRALAAEAGLPRAKVHAHFPWRMTLTSDLSPEAGAV